eukprot:TRINITY_DN3083_c0_g1_i3.p1 TRINITY_DN3083_c0_g1~~TRINITY_DN3083_c0_g1_i3.p1  ORF type:complete len:1051 (-),score=199.17 TRINITY_DN3083_c0_g1_i3:34-2943(-)
MNSAKITFTSGSLQSQAVNLTDSVLFVQSGGSFGTTRFLSSTITTNSQLIITDPFQIENSLMQSTSASLLQFYSTGSMKDTKFSGLSFSILGGMTILGNLTVSNATLSQNAQSTLTIGQANQDRYLIADNRYFEIANTSTLLLYGSVHFVGLKPNVSIYGNLALMRVFGSATFDVSDARLPEVEMIGGGTLTLNQGGEIVFQFNCTACNIVNSGNLTFDASSALFTNLTINHLGGHLRIRTSNAVADRINIIGGKVSMLGTFFTINNLELQDGAEFLKISQSVAVGNFLWNGSSIIRSNETNIGGSSKSLQLKGYGEILKGDYLDGVSISINNDAELRYKTAMGPLAQNGSTITITGTLNISIPTGQVFTPRIPLGGSGRIAVHQGDLMLPNSAIGFQITADATSTVRFRDGFFALSPGGDLKGDGNFLFIDTTVFMASTVSAKNVFVTENSELSCNYGKYHPASPSARLVIDHSTVRFNYTSLGTFYNVEVRNSSEFYAGHGANITSLTISNSLVKFSGDACFGSLTIKNSTFTSNFTDPYPKCDTCHFLSNSSSSLSISEYLCSTQYIMTSGVPATTGTTSTSTSGTDYVESSSSDQNRVGMIAGAVVGALAFIIISLIGVFIIVNRRRHQGAVLEASKPVEVIITPNRGTGTDYAEYNTTEILGMYDVAPNSPKSQDQNPDDFYSLVTMPGKMETASSRIPASALETDWDIDYQEIELVREIGRGSSGVVYQGRWRKISVAVKQILTRSLSAVEEEKFRQEIALMKNIRPHSNVIQCYGVSTFPLALVTEFMENGSLYELLQSDRQITDQIRMKIITGIALGMFHLHKEKVVHRDLAARNVLLSQNFEPKISDFGLARVNSENDDNQTTSNIGPIKWMAPECISELKYSTASDVWAYGCTLVEILTRRAPYGDMDLLQIAGMIVYKDLKPDIPENAPAVVASVMELCFKRDPLERPSFDKICDMLC